jgi:hypothetical protein
MLEQPCDLEKRDELEPIGRARRFRSDDDQAEIWLLPRSDEAAAKRLTELGAARVGGFLRAGLEDDAVWIVRRTIASKSADRSARPWREVIGIVHALAGALAACEARALFPGPIRWSELSFDPPCIAAEPLVRAIVGAAASTARTSADPSLKWTPPEQAAGEPWDSAANRYVLGLVAYRLIAGRHPFDGAGLRHAAQEQATSDPPPFQEEIARTLRPGVQSFVLRLLAADRSARPPSARAIAAQCEELLAESKKSGDAPKSSQPSKKQAPLRSVAVPASSKRKSSLTERSTIRLASLAPVVVGAAAALFAFAARSADRPSKPKIAPVTPLTDGRAEACGSCHTREVAEWSRSAMAFSAKSPLYGGLESLVEEQFAKSNDCPNGAGVLRNAGADACVDRRTGIAITGTGGEDWCVNCHSPGVNLGAKLAKPMTAWSALGSSASREPASELLSDTANEGVSCIACHTSTHGAGPANRNGGAYSGNGQWTSPFTGATFFSRPEDNLGKFGIANSAYFLDARAFFRDLVSSKPSALDPIVHRSSTDAAREYRSSSEFCGACHDVRLFGTDAIGVRERGEHFKRLRNAYSEWRAWADAEERSGKKAATCQGCHMSLYPGSCEPGASASKTGSQTGDCPSGTHFVARAAGEMSTDAEQPIFSHYFTSVDFPLAPAFPEKFIDDLALDASGTPLGMRARQRMLLKASFDFSIGESTRTAGVIKIPINIENVGAGHRVPAGFSQEREIWVELEVTDARGDLVYEVGKIENAKEDLHDKIFLRVNTSDASRDFLGRPLGVFGADVIDGGDAPNWSPNPNAGGSVFAGRGLINFQNGFLRCVRCIGEIDPFGRCNPVGNQSQTRAGKFDDGAYDVDTGECRSNLSGGNEFFETYFPVGALDADRGLLKAPDAIIDTRSAPPDVPLLYTYVLDSNGHPPPYEVHAKLHFRAFPPYLIRAFADYEAQQAAQGKRPNGPQVTTAMLDRLEILDLAEAHTRVE